MTVFPNIALVPRREVCYFQFDEAIQLMSEYLVEMEIEGCPLSPEMNARFDELKRQFCHFAGLLHAVNYMISGDSGEDRFDEMVKEEEEYRLGNRGDRPFGRRRETEGGGLRN